MTPLDFEGLKPLYPNPLTGEMTEAPPHDENDDLPSGMVFKTTFRYSIDLNKIMKRTSRWKAFGNLLLAIRYGSWRGVKHYARVVRTGRTLEGFIYNPGV